MATAHHDRSPVSLFHVRRNGSPSPGRRWRILRRTRPVQLCPTGELDVATAPALGASVASALDSGAREVIVDLRGVTFTDVSGARSLLRVQRLARSRGRSLVFIRGPHRLHQVLETTGVLDELDVLDRRGLDLPQSHAQLLSPDGDRSNGTNGSNGSSNRGL
jgi:anti-anti-sigma factor